MPRSPPSPNQLLASLSTGNFERLRPFLKNFELVYGAVLFEAGDTINRVFFPHSGVISLVVSLDNGDLIETAMIGRDGVAGASSALDGRTSMSNAIVQLPGTASVLEVERLRAEKYDLRDPESAVSIQPEFAKNEYRSLRPELLVIEGVCTHLGCIPQDRFEPKRRALSHTLNMDGRTWKMRRPL